MSLARVVGRLGLGVVVAAVVLALLELTVRIVAPALRTASLPDTMIRAHLDSPGFRADPDLYWYWARLPSPAMQINEHGFRRVAPMTVARPAGVSRVAVFGDSQTLGAGLGPDATYAAVAERTLNADGGRWEVLNAGISGFRSLNVYRLLKLRMLAYELDYIVIDCMPFDSPRDDGYTVGRPHGGVAQEIRSLLWQSRLFHVLELGVEELRPGRHRWLDRPAAPRDALGTGNHDLIAIWAEEHGITSVFMEYPVKAEAGRVDCRTLPNELPPGVAVVPACRALQAEGRRAEELCQDANHLTEAGAEVVGRALAETLARQPLGEG